MNPSRAKFALDRTGDGIAFWIHVTPRPKRPGVGGQHGDSLRVAVAAAPLAGKASAARLEALATAVGCSRREVEIDPTSKGGRKRVKILGDRSDLEFRLRALAQAPRLG